MSASYLYLEFFYVRGYSTAYILAYIFIRYVYFPLIYAASLLVSMLLVFQDYKSEMTLREKFSKAIVISVVLYPPFFLCFFVVKNILLPSPAGYYLVVSGALFIIFCLMLRFSGVYKVHSITSQFISFKKKPFGRCGVVSTLLWGDCYRIMAAIEIEELPRERIRFKQRPLQTEQYFRRMGVEEYQSEVGAYLKKCEEGVAEIQLIHDKDILLHVRRYAIAEGRRYVSTLRRVKEALNYLNGALKALPFDLKTHVFSSQELCKLFGCSAIISHRGKDKDVLELEDMITGTREYLGIVCIKGTPEIDAFAEVSQVDRLIRSCMNFKASITFLVNFQKGKIVKEKEKYIQLDAEEHLSSKRIGAMLKYQRERAEASDLAVGQVEGYPRVSTQLIVKTWNEEACKRYVHELEGIVNSIWSGIHHAPEIQILSGRALKKAYGGSVLRKAVVKRSSQMSIMRLKSLVHFPELPHGLGIAAHFVPEFELPNPVEVHEGNKLQLGYILVGDERVQDLLIEVESLRKTLTIFGRIGTGKTTLVKLLLRELVKTAPDIDFLVFDYKNELKEVIKTAPEAIAKDIMVYVPVSDYAPLQVNIFDPRERVIEEHVNDLIGLFREVYSRMFSDYEELSPQMERVLTDVLKRVVESPSLRQAGFEGFMLELERYGKEHQQKFSFLDRTITALENRLNRFREGALGKIFNVKASNIDLERLLSQKMVINLAYMRAHGCTEEDTRFLMNLLMLYYSRSAHSRGLQDYLRNMVIAEEAQYLVPELHRKVFSIDGTVTQRLPILLRAFGVGFVLIATRPTIAEDIIENSYSKISFQLGRDAEILQKYMNLNEEQVKYLRRMGDREALFFSPKVVYPCRFKTLDYESVSVTADEVKEHNRKYHPELYVDSSIDLETESKELKKRLCKQRCEAYGIQEICWQLSSAAYQFKDLVNVNQLLRLLEAIKKKSITADTLYEFLATEVKQLTKSKVNNPSLCLCLLVYLISADYRVFTQYNNRELEEVVSSIAQLVRREHTQSLLPQEKNEVVVEEEEKRKEKEKEVSKEAIFCNNCVYEKRSSECKDVYHKVEEQCRTLKSAFLQRLVFDLNNSLIDHTIKDVDLSHLYCFFKRIANVELPQKKLAHSLKVDEITIVRLIKEQEQKLDQRLEAIVKERCSFCKDIEQLECKLLLSEVERDLEAINDSMLTTLKSYYNGVAFEVFCNYVLNSQFVQQKETHSYLICFLYRLLKRLTVRMEGEEGLYEKIMAILSEWGM